MTEIELKRLKVELARVSAAKMEQELRIFEHQENIDRLQDAIVIQTAKEEELKEKIKIAESEKV